MQLGGAILVLEAPTGVVFHWSVVAPRRNAMDPDLECCTVELISSGEDSSTSNLRAKYSNQTTKHPSVASHVQDDQSTGVEEVGASTHSMCVALPSSRMELPKVLLDTRNTAVRLRFVHVIS